ncbi:hypothetical protein EV182_001947 [Spiromyces aspiralis]|uniref:Uncharacterized protein n=1 Tax=Spiromyces aspiralis TaxID=68401 RepID=A0ACC1HER4_9FUNG|nr:hypothetical protein EV182_001947 [Spiromyces aspiralis]
MQYMVTAYDFKDSDAINRRMAAREQHLKVAGEMHSAKRLVYGGAILSDEGKMVGSTLVYEADSIDEVRELVKNDPYTVGKVWDPENTTIQQIRLAKF